MVRLERLIADIVTADVNQLKKDMYKTDIRNEYDDVVMGKFSIIYSADQEETYGIRFVEESLLSVLHIPTNEVILEAEYNQAKSTWSVKNPGYNKDIPLSNIIALSVVLRELLK